MLCFVAYYRVSTRRQQDSGLGLDAQRAAVAGHIERCGGKLVAEYTEQESGRRSDRPELQAAIKRTRGLRGAVLIVAKLDRLSRDMEFTATLLNSGIEFVACDNPHANRLTIHILAAIAENEAVAIATRTREALAVAKAKGVKLGTHREGHWINQPLGEARGLPKARVAAAAIRERRRDDCYGHLLPDVKAWRQAGLSLREIAGRLNQAGHVTTGRSRNDEGKAFGATTVKRMLAR